MVLYQLSWWTAGPLVRLGFRLNIRGKENIPSDGPAILASNHLSFLDHVLLPMATQRQIHFISKIQHFDKKFRGWYFRQIGVIPLKRGEGDNVAFERALQTLRNGDLFAIYPEGTRSKDGKLHRGHTGVARLAYLTGAPVVPVAMHGTFDAMPKGASMPKLAKCGVTAGAAIAFPKDEAVSEDRRMLREKTDEIMRAIQALSGQEYVNEYQYNPEVATHRGDEHPESDGPE